MKGQLVSFKEFLNMDAIEQIEAVTGVKLRFYQRFLIRWWTTMKKINSHLNVATLFESIKKGRL